MRLWFIVVTLLVMASAVQAQFTMMGVGPAQMASGGGGGGAWVLATNFWNDGGVWADGSNWQD